MTVLLSDIKSHVLQRLNMEHSTLIADDEFLIYINNSAAALYSILVSKYGDDYFVTETYANVATGSDTITLPSDHLKLMTVDVSVDGTSDGYYPLQRWVINERGMYSNATQDPLLFLRGDLRYKVHGTNAIKLRPASLAGNRTYRIWYIPAYPNATALSDALPTTLGLQNWHEYIINDVCILVLGKQDTDASLYVMRQQQLADRIAKQAANRDVGKPLYMADPDIMHDRDPLGFYR